jgi:DNA excision repair protein ERCC-4
MKEIQTAIAAAVQTCIRELKHSTTLLEWTDADLSVENCVTTNFDKAISRQLEHDWHRLKPQTKQLVQDLRTLRTLFQYLIHYDCVSFWKLINSIKTMSAASVSRHASMWLLTPAADVLFRTAKERIYTIVVPKPTLQVPKPVAKLKPVLEENPKWRLLRNVLDEIQQDYEEKKQHRDETGGPANVLVMVKDERTLESLRSYLVDGRERTMTLQWLRYLESYNDRSRSVTNSTGGTAAISEESRLLLEEEGRARSKLFGRKGRATSAPSALSPEKRQLNAVPDYMRKRRRIAVEKGRGEQTLQGDDLDRRAVLDEAVEEMEHDLSTQKGYDIAARVQGNVDDDDSDVDEYDVLFTVTEPDELRVVIRTYTHVDGDEATLLLQDLQPSYIILYDADTSFVRSIEIFSSLQDEREERLRVYFMLFEASAEEKTFLKSLEREQNAFERLIYHKKTMPLPVHTLAGTTQEMQQAMASGSAVSGSYADGALPLSVDTRTGKGKARIDIERRDIAVDVREFRSALPSILHQGGMRLAPVTLIVGDFVLSNVHCVERKSISDLFGSFASGRLYTQAEAMSKYYKCPCLLIEFDPSKSFCLQNSNELGVEIRTESVCSKMCLLTMHFPQLRILWSRSPHETLRIFKSLKTNHDEVNVDRAMEIGRSEELDDAFVKETDKDDDEEEDEVNEAARDMLLRLPGVNVHNARNIMKECDRIAELAEMPRDQLRKIAGPVTGQKLFTFFRQKMAAT